jgi:hypothetical protein
MGHRFFRDSRGTDWQAWDVVPHLAERRTGERRSTTSGGRLPAGAIERRRRPERRITSGRRPVLSAGLDDGWLCFEASAEKRRLTPIPADWLRCDDACLERYLGDAKPVRRSAAIHDISGFDGTSD